MTVFTGTNTFYLEWGKLQAQNVVLPTDTLIMLLTTSGYTPNLSTNTVLADITNEVSGSGYARQTLGSVTWNRAANVTTLDFADPVFTAAGGSIVARRWVIFDDTVASPVKPLVATGLIDNADADVTVTSGNTLTFNINASGLYTLTTL